MSAKIKRSLIILLLALVVIIGAVAAILLIPGSDDENSEAAALMTITDPISVSFGPGDNVTEYILTDGVWYYAQDTSWPIVQNGVTRILDHLSEIVPTRTIEASDELSAYGLDPAVYVLTLTDAEGNSETLYVGSAAGDSARYAKLEGDDAIYIFSTSGTNMVSFLSSTLYNMVDAEEPPSMGEVAIVEMTVSYGGKTASFKQDEEDGWFYLGEDGSWIVEEEYSAVGSDGESHTARKYLNDVGEAVPSFKSRGCAAYGCTESELSEMGFDAPLVVEVFKTDGTTVIYSVGNRFTADDGTEYYYFTTEGNPAVLYMPAAAVEPFIELITVLGR